MYSIKITKTEKVPYKAQEYQKIADSGNEKDGKAVYAYVPLETIRDKVTDVLVMEMEELDVKKVVNALINS